jgi:energy-converting hydrogenase Eha subunit B
VLGGKPRLLRQEKYRTSLANVWVHVIAGVASSAGAGKRLIRDKTGKLAACAGELLLASERYLAAAVAFGVIATLCVRLGFANLCFAPAWAWSGSTTTTADAMTKLSGASVSVQEQMS